MAITIDWSTLIFSIPQADLSLVSGTLYDADTETVIRAGINAIMDDEDGIVFDTPISHNTEVTVAGTTFARTVEMINGYSVTFTPNTQWTARLLGSNNNFFDVEGGILNQNQVQVIPTNSAGLIKGSITDQIVEGTHTVQDVLRLISSILLSKLSGGGTATEVFRDIDDTKNRVTATVDSSGNRTAIVLDET